MSPSSQGSLLPATSSLHNPIRAVEIDVYLHLHNVGERDRCAKFCSLIICLLRPQSLL
jgi:hypothetical protein